MHWANCDMIVITVSNWGWPFNAVFGAQYLASCEMPERAAGEAANACAVSFLRV